MKRKIKDKIMQFLKKDISHKALLVTGARQIGKTYIIRQCLKEHSGTFVEINFVENEEARKLFLGFKDTKDIL